MNRELEIRERVAQYGMALLGADRVEMDVTRDNLEFYVYSDLRHLLDETARLRAELAAMTAERDAMRERAEAAERDMIDAVRYRKDCQTCKHYKGGFCLENSGGRLCGVQSRWEWRGPVAENKEGKHADA